MYVQTNMLQFMEDTITKHNHTSLSQAFVVECWNIGISCYYIEGIVLTYPFERIPQKKSMSLMQ